MTRVEFVNHASYLLKHREVQLLCDPWLDGAAFDNGWDLLAQTRFPYERFRQVTHIWFSHEHPDHFSPPNLSKIAPQIRAGITVLYQRSLDKKVCNYCRKLGFGRVIEMPPGEWLNLGPGFDVLCEPHDNGDSWLAARCNQLVLLNLNDCVVTSKSECARITSKIGAVDVLATQFSYANWVGNAGDYRAMAAAADEKLTWLKTQVLELRPRYVLPFASFVYFSHEDDFHLNEGMNRIGPVAELIRSQTDALPVVLYPGDEWRLDGDDAYDCEPALQQYAEDYERVRTQGYRHRSTAVPIDTLLEHGEKFAERLRSKNGSLVSLLPTATIFVEDHGEALALSARGLQRIARERDGCDLACKSDALDYCLLTEWGGRTLDINGRFQVPDGGSYWKFKIYATLANFNNRGESFPEIAKTVQKRLLKKVERVRDSSR